MPIQFYTPPQAAEVLQINSDKVLAWIHSGELVAVNVAANGNGERPRWRIAEEELGKFLLRRRHTAAVDEQPSRKRRSRTTAAKPHFA